MSVGPLSGMCPGEFTPGGNPCDGVLVAEDDPIFRKVLQTWLERWGCKVTVAEDGEQAWQLLQSETPCSLLMLDWMMPGIDGLELCRRVRATPRNRYQYILLVTSRDAKKDVISGLEAGADDYLTKPFDMNELRARLRVGKRILALQEELIAAREGLRFQATHDGLTGIWNGTAVLEILQHEIDRAARSQGALGVLLLDIDRFKNINDTYGHLVGDVVLREVAQRVAGAVRSYDSVGRYGGEEFLIVLPGCGESDVRESAERVRLAVCGTPVATTGTQIQVTISVGATVVGDATSAHDAVCSADTAMYSAKRAGRNRSEVFSGQ